jgi:predicted peptidase
MLPTTTRRDGRRDTARWLPAALLALAAPSAAPAQETGFVSRSVEVGGVDYAYQVFVPPQWTRETTWPVILYLHGAGESGSDGVQQTQRGLPERIRGLRDFPAIVVMPQCRSGAWWGTPEMEAQAFQALDAAMGEFNGDPARLYLTGISMGGYGVWAFGYKYPGRFAALVPVCGGVVSWGRRRIPVPEWHPAARAPEDPYAETARGIGKVPVWAFHGAEDPRVPVSESQKLTAALKAAGAEVRYTEYQGVAHNSWDRAYAEEELIPWLLAHTSGAERTGGGRPTGTP